MTEKEQIKNILIRMNRTIFHEDENSIEFMGDGYENIVIEFDENGLVIAIY